MFLEILHYFLTLLIVISGTCIFLSNNPVSSVLFLILNFCIAAIILFLFEVEFLGLLFIMVYVGAVAVLFLFVVMMINTKKLIIKKISLYQIFFISLIITLLFINIKFTLQDIFFNEYDTSTISKKFNSKILTFDNLTNIEVIAQSLYNNYNIAVLLAGFVLLIALVGCICLTIDLKQNKISDKSYKQLSKNYNEINKIK